jgi:hypothetical protein
MLKKIILILLLFTVPSNLFASWTIIASTGDGSPGTGGGSPTQVQVITGNIDTTGANRIFVCVHDYNGGGRTSDTPQDSKSNTWTQVAEKLEAGGTHVRLYISGTSPTVGSGHNFTVTGTGSAPANNVYPGITVLAVGNAGTHDTDGTPGNNSSAGAVNLTSGSVTPSQTGDLIISCLTQDNAGPGGAKSIDSSLTICTGSGGNPGCDVETHANHLGGGMAYLSYSSTSAINPQWSWTNSLAAAGVTAAFKDTTGGGGGGGGGGSTMSRMRIRQ